MNKTQQNILIGVGLIGVAAYLYFKSKPKKQTFVRKKNQTGASKQTFVRKKNQTGEYGPTTGTTTIPGEYGPTCPRGTYPVKGKDGNIYCVRKKNKEQELDTYTGGPIIYSSYN